MKQCPQCHRRYSDETLNYCLDDGETLLYGPGSSEPATAILPASKTQSEAATEAYDAPRISERGSPPITDDNYSVPVRRTHRARLAAALFAVLIVAGIFAYRSLFPSVFTAPTVRSAVDEPKPLSKVYWEMSEAEQTAFIRERAQHIQKLIGDDPTDFDDDAIQTIKLEVDDYVRRKDSLSQKPFEEGLRVIYGRSMQYAPLVVGAYRKTGVPPALGLYQAMIESEYHDCPATPFPKGPVGMFQFSRKTAAKYDLQPSDYCDVTKQSDAAARYMADLSSDFGEGKSNATLGLLSYSLGEGNVRDYLRQLRGRGITERSYWIILRSRKLLGDDIPDLLPPPAPLIERELSYVPRFFAAAIIGETPGVFGLPTPPLSTVLGDH